MAIYTELTDLLEEIQRDDIGSWVIDRKNDGSLGHPIQVPYVSYSELVIKFMDTVYSFERNHPEYGLNSYRDILERHGIKWNNSSMEAADAANLDGVCVMALLLGAIRAERFCEGALLAFFKGGSIQRWLERLREIDEGGKE